MCCFGGPVDGVGGLQWNLLIRFDPKPGCPPPHSKVYLGGFLWFYVPFKKFLIIWGRPKYTEYQLQVDIVNRVTGYGWGHIHLTSASGC